MAIKNSWASGEVLLAADLTDSMKGVFVNAQTGTTYTFGTADGFVTLSNASGGTVTIPTNSTAAFNTGAVIGVMNAGTAGSFTIGTAAGVTLNAASGATTLAPLEAATLVKLATNTWQLAKGGGVSGKVLQVVRATDTTDRTTTSTSFVDVTGMAVTITPQVATSKIFILAIFNSNSVYGTGTEGFGTYQITDSSNTAISGAEGSLIGRAVTVTATTNSLQASILSAWASPGSISAVTYKMRFKSGAATTTIIVRNSYSTGQMYAIEVAA